MFFYTDLLQLLLLLVMLTCQIRKHRKRESSVSVNERILQYRNSCRNYFSGISVERGLRFLAATPNGVDWCVIRSRQAVKGVGRWRRAVILLPGLLQSARKSVVFISVLPKIEEEIETVALW